MVYFLILSEERLLSGACLRWISPPCVTVAARKERERERSGGRKRVRERKKLVERGAAL